MPSDVVHPLADDEPQQLKDDEPIREHARSLMRTGKSPRSAAKALGVSRETYLSLAAGAPVTRGTLALVRERIALARNASIT